MPIIARLMPLIALLWLLPAQIALGDEIPRIEAIKAIIGESASEPDCMSNIASAIKRRGTLKGVYGLNNPYVSKASGQDYQRASKAWEESPMGKADHWLTPGELKKPSVQWYKKCKYIESCGSHGFYSCP